jgi:hypothetical protein
MAAEETIDYFDLVVECGKVVLEQIPDHLTPTAYFRKRIQDAWHDLNTYMTGPLHLVKVSGSTAYQDHLNNLLARLAREASMAAWALAIQVEDGEDNPEVVAKQFTSMTVKAKIHL